LNRAPIGAAVLEETVRYDSLVFAIRLLVEDAAPWGFLEWFFASMLTLLVLAVGGFSLYVAVQLFRNPSRRPRTRF
jgi:hypothetical protein